MSNNIRCQIGNRMWSYFVFSGPSKGKLSPAQEMNKFDDMIHLLHCWELRVCRMSLVFLSGVGAWHGHGFTDTRLKSNSWKGLFTLIFQRPKRPGESGDRLTGNTWGHWVCLRRCHALAMVRQRGAIQTHCDALN